MIERTGSEYILSCDYCGYDSHIMFDNFYDAVEWKKDHDNGWKSINENSEWHDVCPDCNKES